MSEPGADAAGVMQAVRIGARTEVGRVRPGNQDAYLAEGRVFAVADGMGGHAGGATASRIATECLRGLSGLIAVTPSDLARVISEANARMVQEIAADPDLEGMGTTCVGLVLVDQEAQPYWLGFNVGDSRLYRLAEGEFSRLSTDHSVVQELIDAGALDPRDAPDHRERNVVTRALGSDPEPVIDYWLLTPQEGERFLICSDGLTGEVSEAYIADVLRNVAEPSDVVDVLIQAALAAGGRDNVTVVVVEHGSPTLGSAGASTDDTIERPAPRLGGLPGGRGETAE